MHVLRRHLRRHQGADVAHLAVALDVLGCGVRDFHRTGGIAGRVDDVIELVGAVRGGEGEERVQGRFDVGSGEIDGVAGDAGLGVRVAGAEAGDGLVDLGLTGAGDGDGGAVFETGFCDAEAEAGCAADDEDALSAELGAVFGGHWEALGVMEWLVMIDREEMSRIVFYGFRFLAQIYLEGAAVRARSYGLISKAARPILLAHCLERECLLPHVVHACPLRDACSKNRMQVGIHRETGA